MRGFWATLVLATLLVIGVPKAAASGFHINSISNVETGGRQLSHWWYTGSAPVFHGEATPGAEVVVDIDGKALSINADSSGNWDFQSDSLSDGDHQVSITSSGSTISFTLTTGREKVDWNAVGSGNVETMPAAGTSWPTITLIMFGLGAAATGGKMVFNVKK